MTEFKVGDRVAFKTDPSYKGTVVAVNTKYISVLWTEEGRAKGEEGSYSRDKLVIEPNFSYKPNCIQFPNKRIKK